MNFKQKLESVLEFLGFKQKFADKSLTQEEFSSIVAEYQKRYQTTLQDDLAAPLLECSIETDPMSIQRSRRCVEDMIQFQHRVLVLQLEAARKHSPLKAEHVRNILFDITGVEVSPATTYNYLKRIKRELQRTSHA